MLMGIKKKKRLNQSRAQSVVWLLEELNLSYDLKVYKRQADMLAPPALKEIHPLGKSPVITLENENTSSPMVLAESGVIIEYMCDHFDGDKLVPKRYHEGKEGQIGGETDEWMRHKYFMHYVEGSLMPFLVMQLVMDGNFSFPFPQTPTIPPRSPGEDDEEEED